MNVRIWRHHREDHGGLLRAAFERRGANVVEELVGASSRPTPVSDADILVILGSSESVYDTKISWINDEIALMMEAARFGVRIFGVCFGAQMLCVAHGGAVERAPKGELGWVRVDSRIEGIETGPWFQYHNDHCLVPTESIVLATNEAAVQAFSIGRHLGVQFHPEVDAAQLTDWFANDTDAHRSGADVEGFINYARQNSSTLTNSADKLVGHFLGELN